MTSTSEARDFLAVIDPTWSTEAGGGGRGAQRHYALSDADGIAGGYLNSGHWPSPLRSGFSADRAPLRALVWMWTTGSAILSGDAHIVARLLGLRPCAEWVWCKVDELLLCPSCKMVLRHIRNEPHSPDTFECECAREWDLDLFSTDCGPPAQLAYVHPRRLGLGQWSRKEHEHLWLLRAGAVKVPPPQVRPRSIIYAPRGRHSEKPQAAWDVIEAVSRSVLPGVVGVEFNSRERRFGWAAFGALDGEDQPLRFESTDDREDDQGGRT